MIEEKERDSRIDILKGIAIILMVLGHSGMPEGIIEFIYLFHMAVFFIASGYCYKEKYSEDGQAIKSFFGRRIKKIYVPYVIWMIILVLMHNLFVTLHIYTDLVSFTEGKLGNSYGTISRYSVTELITEILKALFVLGGGTAVWYSVVS